MKISITVDVEEWFHTNWFDSKQIIQKYYGKAPQTDVMEKTKELIQLFNNNNVEATFFILGETALKYPELMDLFEDNNHEIACHGFYHNKRYNNSKEFQLDIKKFKEKICPDMNGFRFPNFDYSNEKLKVVKEEGFIYDSSVVPCLNIPGWYGESDSPIFPHKKDIGGGDSIIEFPVSVLPYLRLPGSGGWFLRNLGYIWTKKVIKFCVKKYGYGMIYIHPWEISDRNPNFDGINFHVFRNTGFKTLKSFQKLIKSLSSYDFITFSEQLNGCEIE